MEPEQSSLVEEQTDTHELRSVAQLNMLHSLAAQLNQLNDVKAIADAITAELGRLIDLHNCRVYLLTEDGRTLVPIAFRGELTEYEGETYEELVTTVGEGITGHAARTRRTFYAPNAATCEVGVLIPGTADIDESMVAAPMLYGDRLVGVIVLSKLGIGRFDTDDVRLLEVLASHAATAFENARLFQLERSAAATASTLLGLSQILTDIRDTSTVLERVVASVPSIIASSVVASYIRDADTGSFNLARQRGANPERAAHAAATGISRDTASRFLLSVEDPFLLTKDMLGHLPAEVFLTEEPRDALVAPLRWEPDGFAVLVVVAPGPGASFDEQDLLLARGIADITSLALGNARRFHELERFHELVDSLEAAFWEADPATRRFGFLSRRAATLLGGSTDRGAALPERWGEHIHPDDRTEAIVALEHAIEEGGDHSLEYRTLDRDGEAAWLRDLVHVVRDARGTAVLRGLIVDITERKRAEEALRRSERKYSEAFHREREAAQRLRALDEMKNTFLEAVSHDLRTPLTSILGSALTLEQTNLGLPPADSIDLVRRIAANARKLERLLSDLLDLDRLQRGIVTPIRRPTDVGALVAQAVHGSDQLADHPVELDASPVVASVDAAKVERIVENLLSNAARHTPPGTPIWVRVRPSGDGVLIVVEDAGPGVPQEMRDEIFEPFRQASGRVRHAPGVGVGLSLVARFAELHGGSAWVEERPGGGASFRVHVPAE